MQKRRIIFIAGLGRSGSTLLEALLTRGAQTFAVGEFRNVWGPYFDPRQLCGCGRPVDSCEFWSPLFRIQGGIDGFVESMTAMCGNAGRIRHIPRYLRGEPGFSSAMVEYSERLNDVYNRIADASGYDTIIDSSKEVAHGYVLTTLKDFEVFVVHLVRDSRAVANSWARRKRKPEVHWTEEYLPRYKPRVSAFKWMRANVLAMRLRRVCAGYMILRYEDLAMNPHEHIHSILQMVEIPPSEVDQYVGASHSVAGNPMRFSTVGLSVTRDDSWVQEMPVLAKLTVTALTLPLLKMFGYTVSRGISMTLNDRERRSDRESSHT